jgi:hypothetical protein
MELLNEDYFGRWTGRGGQVAWPTQSPDLNCLWDSMMLRVYHGGKPEARHQLVEATDEATIGIRQTGTHAVAQ